ncbi:MAG TPA: hypothetical protein VFC19_45020 [Candidatus Limnocylindrales bacterium]|nr:hypothetical protein [Candidatus Limnocylindrales bacterium]
MSTYYDHYRHNPDVLAAACDRGAADLRREAAEALAQGDQSRHDRKLRAADFAQRYADTVRTGQANLDHAQIVAHAANMSGILIDARMPDDPWQKQWDPQMYMRERELAAQRKAELSSAAEAGLVSRVDDPGQVAFYTLAGYEPDGYDPITHTTNLRDQHTDQASRHTADTAAPQTTDLAAPTDTSVHDDADGMDF